MTDESKPHNVSLTASKDDSSGGLSFTPVLGSSGMTYRPILELGEGGMARVFLAHAAGPNDFTKLVVLKMMRRQHLTDPGSRQMFLAEARLSARLNHPNLVQVYEVNQAADAPCLVMEYLDGKPLSLLRAGEHITSKMLLTIICEALAGLHHAHELKDFDGKPLEIVHRDISPHNLIATYDGAVKVLDFGIAKVATAATETKTGEIKGKLTYMAPEQLLGNAIDRRADVFAVGSMLWDAAIGSRMWDNVSEGVLMQRLVTGEIPRPSERGPIDPILEAIIVKATAAKPEDRYATALDLQRDLDEYLSLSGGRVPLRDIGSALAETFAEDRAENAAAISRALKQSLPPPPATPMGLEAPILERKSTLPLVLTVSLLFFGVFTAWRLGVFQEKTAPAAVSEPASITLQLVCEPSQARIEVDGKDVGSAGAALRLPKDAREHEIRISAPGHVTETRLIRFDRSQSVQVRLQKLAVPPEPEVQPAPSASAAPRVRKSSQIGRPHAILPQRPVSSAATASEVSSAEKCNPPYYFQGGIKTYKPECL